MKLIVHAGTGTIIDADDDVYIIDTDAIKDESLGALLEDGDESEVIDIAIKSGRKLRSDELEMSYGNSMTFTPTSIRQEIQENPFMPKKLEEGVSEWLENASQDDFDFIAGLVMADELLWQNYMDILAHAINETFRKKGHK